MYPALHNLISQWSPPEEKGKFVGALLGGTLGTVITWPALGAIIEAWGWEWAFFVPGAITVIWSIVWMMLVSDTPESHKSISENEKIYIIKSLGDSINKDKVIGIP